QNRNIDEQEEKEQQPLIATDAFDDSGEHPFVSCMTLEEAEKLRPNDKIDHRDDVGRFLLAQVVEKQGSMLKVHYDGWNSKWDVWSDYTRELSRFAASGSISQRL
ncbi:hypothetical protein RFI_33328, partial [Reticulomyxa filosa]